MKKFSSERELEWEHREEPHEAEILCEMKATGENKGKSVISVSS